MTTAMEDDPSGRLLPSDAAAAAPVALLKATKATTATATTATATATPAPATTAATVSSPAKEEPAPARRPAAVRKIPAADLLSDKATLLLIRRTLCPTAATGAGGVAAGGVSTGATAAGISGVAPTPPAALPDQPLEDLLPPLTSRNDVDRQLYALLAIVVREFVLPWYARITPHEQFVTELVRIVAHATRAVEQRLRRVDLESLLLDELPALLDNHIGARRASRAAMARPPIYADPRAVYHALWPLPALAPVVPSRDGGEDAAAVTQQQAANEAAYRQLLVQGVLAALLPPEDLANECLTALVGQIAADLLLGNVLARRVAEPWMMWEIVGLLARLVREKMDTLSGNNKEHASRGRKRTSMAERETTDPPGLGGRLLATASAAFWTTLNVGFLLFASLRFLVTSISLARTLPPRGGGGGVSSSTTHSEKDTTPLLPPPPPPADEPIPVLCFAVWPTAANIAQLDLRMPWLSGAISLLQWLALAGPGRIGALNRPLDRLLSHYLRRSLLDPALLPTLLRAVRASLFPGNKFGAAPPTLVAPADDAAVAALRRRTAAAVYAVWGGDTADDQTKQPSEAMLQEIDGGVLALFDDAYCNKHLLYGVLEAVLVRLVPELADEAVPSDGVSG